MSTQEPIKISKIMTKKLETIGSASTAQDIAIKMSKEQVSSLLVIDDKDGNPLGIVTEQDLARKVCVNDKSSKDVLAVQIMSSSLVTVNANSSPSDAADLMLKNKIRHLLVVKTEPNQDENRAKVKDNQVIVRPVGILTPMDFTRYKVTGTSGYDKEDDQYDNILQKILEYYKNDFEFNG
jgi:CBS domain-containing protein